MWWRLLRRKLHALKLKNRRRKRVRLSHQKKNHKTRKMRRIKKRKD